MQAAMALIGCLQETATLSPERDAVVGPEICLSYAALLRCVEQQSAALQNAGISETSIVGIHCASDIPHLILNLGLIHAGATIATVPTYEATGTSDRFAFLTHVLDETDAIDPSVNGRPTNGDARLTPAAAATLLFSTSGTTGTAKQVVHLDSDLVAQAHRHIGSESERFACLGSMEQNFVKRHRLYCVAAGATNVFPSSASSSLVEQCQRLGVNTLHLSAFQAQELLAVPEIGKLRGIRLKLGGSLVSLSLRRRLRDKVTDHLQCGYGTTETGAIAFTGPDDDDAGETVGKPLPGIEISVVDTNRCPVASGERGELAIRCDGMFRGYHNRPDLTADVLEDGWFYTGDVGYLDSRQRIYLRGRSDDMFVFNSMNIYPQDIESAICEHPDIDDAVVVPRPSTVHGNIPVALVVLRNGASASIGDIRTFVRQRTGVRCPRQFVTVGKIPRNSSGKIARNDSEALCPGVDHVRRTLIELLNTSNPPKVRPAQAEAFIRGDRDLSLKSLRLDSLARMNLMIMLEVEHDTVVTPEAFSQLRTLGDVCALVMQRADTLDDDSDPASSDVAAVDANSPSGTEPYLLRFFRRVVQCCPTVAQLYKAQTTLEHRLTPADVAHLHEKHLQGQLLPPAAANKYHSALDQWFGRLNRLMSNSGKSAPEDFSAARCAPAVTVFRGPGHPAGKTLLICFAGAGSRQMLMPSAVWLQHIDAKCYDVMIVGEPLKQGYRSGVPLLGDTVSAVVRNLGDRASVSEYRELRTIGCSAGAHVAVIAAFQLGAVLGVSAGGRFHSERYPRRILSRFLAMRRAIRNGRRSRIIASYAADKTRDRNFAKVLGWLTETTQLAVKFTDGAIGHLLLQHLVEQGELGEFLRQSLFASTGDPTTGGKIAVIEYPRTSDTAAN